MAHGKEAEVLYVLYVLHCIYAHCKCMVSVAGCSRQRTGLAGKLAHRAVSTAVSLPHSHFPLFSKASISRVHTSQSKEPGRA